MIDLDGIADAVRAFADTGHEFTDPVHVFADPVHAITDNATSSVETRHDHGATNSFTPGDEQQ
jgi:hypothetical protein